MFTIRFKRPGQADWEHFSRAYLKFGDCYLLAQDLLQTRPGLFLAILENGKEKWLSANYAAEKLLADVFQERGKDAIL